MILLYRYSKDIQKREIIIRAQNENHFVDVAYRLNENPATLRIITNTSLFGILPGYPVSKYQKQNKKWTLLQAWRKSPFIWLLGEKKTNWKWTNHEQVVKTIYFKSTPFSSLRQKKNCFKHIEEVWQKRGNFQKTFFSTLLTGSLTTILIVRCKCNGSRLCREWNHKSLPTDGSDSSSEPKY